MCSVPNFGSFLVDSSGVLMVYNRLILCANLVPRVKREPWKRGRLLACVEVRFPLSVTVLLA